MKEVTIKLKLNKNEEIIPIFPDNFNFKDRMKHI